MPLSVCRLAQDDQEKVLLHYAAERQATDNVVHSLLTANHDAAKVKAIGGNLPLHYAASCHASDIVCDKITSAHPDATKARDVAGNLPLHLACQYQATEGVVSRLLAAYNEAAQFFAGGSLPLHYAAAQESSDGVVKVLLMAYPDACRVKDSMDNLPLHLAYGSALRAHEARSIVAHNGHISAAAPSSYPPWCLLAPLQSAGSQVQKTARARCARGRDVAGP